MPNGLTDIDILRLQKLFANNSKIDKDILDDEKRTKELGNAFLWTIGIMELILNLLFLFAKPYWLLVIFPITAIFVYSLYALLNISK